MYKKYSGFKVLNLNTGEVSVYPYVKGQDSRDTEENAINEQMELTGQPRSNFIIHGLIKR